MACELLHALKEDGDLADRETDRQTDRHDRHTDIQTNRQTSRQQGTGQEAGRQQAAPRKGCSSCTSSSSGVGVGLRLGGGAPPLPVSSAADEEEGDEEEGGEAKRSRLSRAAVSSRAPVSSVSSSVSSPVPCAVHRRSCRYGQGTCRGREGDQSASQGTGYRASHRVQGPVVRQKQGATRELSTHAQWSNYTQHDTTRHNTTQHTLVFEQETDTDTDTVLL